MKRYTRFMSCALALAVLFVVPGASGCAPSGPDDGSITTSGSIAEDSVALSVPRLSPEPTATPDPGWSKVTSVPVEPGDVVEAGDVIAVVDDGRGAASVALARAQLDEAEARLDLVGEKREDLGEKRRDVRETRAELVDTLADLRRQRTEVADQLAQARRLAERMPPPGTTPTPPPGEVPGTPGSPQRPPGGAPQQDPRAILAQLESALARLDAGIARAESGLARLDEASGELAEASALLDAAEDASTAMVDARRAGVSLAQARRDLAVVRAPEHGVVTEPPVLGQVLAAGAPLARLRTSGASLEIVTYLTARQARRLEAGDRAAVRIDSRPGESFDAELARLGTEYEYVPTRFATREIHLLRGFEARVRLTEDAQLPPGTPADVTLYPR